MIVFILGFVFGILFTLFGEIFILKIAMRAAAKGIDRSKK